MPLTRKRATIWTCSDGTEHTDFVKAAEHQHALDVCKRLHDILDPRSAYGDIDLERTIEVLMEHRAELGKLFSKTRSVYKREATPADYKESE